MKPPQVVAFPVPLVWIVTAQDQQPVTSTLHVLMESLRLELYQKMKIKYQKARSTVDSVLKMHRQAAPSPARAGLPRSVPLARRALHAPPAILMPTLTLSSVARQFGMQTRHVQIHAPVAAASNAQMAHLAMHTLHAMTHLAL